MGLFKRLGNLASKAASIGWDGLETLVNTVHTLPNPSANFVFERGTLNPWNTVYANGVAHVNGRDYNLEGEVYTGNNPDVRSKLLDNHLRYGRDPEKIRILATDGFEDAIGDPALLHEYARTFNGKAQWLVEKGAVPVTSDAVLEELILNKDSHVRDMGVQMARGIYNGKNVAALTELIKNPLGQVDAKLNACKIIVASKGNIDVLDEIASYVPAEDIPVVARMGLWTNFDDFDITMQVKGWYLDYQNGVSRETKERELAEWFEKLPTFTDATENRLDFIREAASISYGFNDLREHSLGLFESFLMGGGPIQDLSSEVMYEIVDRTIAKRNEISRSTEDSVKQIFQNLVNEAIHKSNSQAYAGNSTNVLWQLATGHAHFATHSASDSERRQHEDDAYKYMNRLVYANQGDTSEFVQRLLGTSQVSDNSTLESSLIDAAVMESANDTAKVERVAAVYKNHDVFLRNSRTHKLSQSFKAAYEANPHNLELLRLEADNALESAVGNFSANQAYDLYAQYMKLGGLNVSADVRDALDNRARERQKRVADETARNRAEDNMWKNMRNRLFGRSTYNSQVGESFKILGLEVVDPSNLPTEDEAKKAYRVAAKNVSPDLHPDIDDNLMKSVNKAWRTVQDYFGNTNTNGQLQVNPAV